ncbi:MAG: hypothetical protein KF862_04890 [Chitinophagaceae bacterium]|nr:hypothetical protein [Chitinophagaceae bacterium]
MAIQKKSVGKKATVKAVTAKKTIVPQKVVVPIPPPKAKKRTLYVHYSSFHPYMVGQPGGYSDFFQEGRSAANGMLISPILLPVGSAMKSITIYYKNNTEEDIMVLVLKHHVQHIAPSGEIEVVFITCPPGTSSPDNFLSVTFNLGSAGKILDKYMYFAEVENMVKTGTQERVLLGMKIVYTEPA